ncbi:MAG TPA: hypothetical protein VF544_24120 [Pyrinomonadaceae bacterium]|jgi:hypothetical protein
MILSSFSPHYLSLLQALSSGAEPTSMLREYLLNPFVLAILFFFLLSFIRLLRYVTRLSEQRAALEQVTENYLEVERKQETDAELIKQDLLRDVSPDSIVAKRVIELQHISVRGGDFDQVALAEVLAARESAKISLARYVASVLVLLGLCGAIWGLSGLIRNMSPALEQVQTELDKNTPDARPSANTPPGAEPSNSGSAIQDSFKRLINTMSQSLASTRGAFYASLTGILASIFLLMCNWLVSGRQVSFLSALEDLTATRLIPIFKPPPEAAQLAEAVVAFREGSNYLVRLSDELDGKVSQVGTSLENLFAVVRKFGEGADALRSHQDRIYQAQEQMMGVVNEFVGLTARIEAHQANTHGDLEGVVRVVGESSQNLTRALEDWSSKHEDMLQAIERNARQAHQETKEARELAQTGINELAGLIRNSVDSQVGTLRAQALELLEQQQVGTRENLEHMLREQGKFVADLQESVGKSDGHQALLSGLAVAIKEERSAFAERLQHVLKQNEQALKALLAEQKQLLDISGMRRVEQGLEQFVRENRTEFSALVNRQAELDQHLGSLSKLAGRLSTMLRILIGVATVTVPVFAALGIMFIFDLRPEDQIMRAGALLIIMAMIFMLAWFLRSKT